MPTHDQSLIALTRMNESRLIEISQLQSVLEYHVYLQAREIESLYDEGIVTQEKIKEGNRYLHSAKEHSSSFRKFVLIFLLLTTLVLLFLDWYD